MFKNRYRLVTGLCALLALAPLPASAAQPAASPPTLDASCPATSNGGSCGSMPVPLDWSQPTGSTITVGWEWYPATNGTATGTVLATDGGPGFSTTSFRDQYRKLFGPLLADHNLLLVDLRGTGESTPLNCDALQKWKLDPTNEAQTRQAYLNDVQSCGQQLAAAGQSDKFTSAAGARDVAAVLGQLGLSQVDFYGVSYGTYFGQVFADRYPQLLRSVTLDSAYPVAGANDLLNLGTVAALRAAYNLACQRSAACAAAGSGGWQAVTDLVNRLRTGGNVTGTYNGHSVVIDIPSVLAMLGSASSSPLIYHDFDAAARAGAHGEDWAPLLRLAQQSYPTGNSGAYNKQFSSAAYQAVTCTDYPTAYDPHADPATRGQQLATATGNVAASATAPFTPNEWVYAQPGLQDSGVLDACTTWPAPGSPEAPLPPPGTLNVPASLPVLILSGDLDTVTSTDENAQVLAQLGGTGATRRLITTPNTGHQTATNDPTNCTAGLLTQFIQTPANLSQLDASCEANVPQVRTVGSFPQTLAAATPATATDGNTADQTALQLASIASATAADALYQYQNVNGSTGIGLRCVSTGSSGSGLDCGSWSFSDTNSNESDGTLSGLHWTQDTTVGGTVTAIGTAVTAKLTVDSPGEPTLTCTVSWTQNSPQGSASITGTIGSATLAASVPAP